MTDGELGTRSRGPDAMRWGLACAVVGAVVWLIGLIITPDRAWVGYLSGYATVTGVVVGCLMMVMIAHVTSAAWFDRFRPVALRIVGALPVLLLLFVPIAIGMHHIYQWIPPLTGMSAADQAKVAEKSAYLNIPFFLIRAAIYLISWIIFAELLRRWSRPGETEQADAPAAVSGRERALSAAGLPLVGLTLSFAAIDWLMSLRPTWFSTVYPLYYFAGGLLGALALLTVLVGAAEQRGDTPPLETKAWHRMGNLLLTMVIFWAYAGFSQLLIIWIGDLPIDIGWYNDRWSGGWRAVGLVLLFGHLVIPFLILLLGFVKRRAGMLVWVAAWLLLMHWLDGYWLVMPEAYRSPPFPWTGLAALTAVGGLTAAAAGWREPAA